MKNITIIFFFLFSITLQANTLENMVKEEKGKQRVALIIGNNNYANLVHLKNPLNDARLMRDTLKKSGFSILYKENAEIKDMKNLLKKFAHKIHKGDLGFFYFAGHSVNVDGKNYLVGIDASLDNKVYISHEAIPLNNIIKKMRSSRDRLNVIISDTCRNTITKSAFGNNHFGRGVGKGLLSLANTEGIYIAYSTATTEIVRDGEKGSHGILTEYFVQNLKKEGATIEEIFQTTKKDVLDRTNSKNIINIYNQMMGDFFFILPPKK
jgi:uncharacterized caspase-like protein